MEFSVFTFSKVLGEAVGESVVIAVDILESLVVRTVFVAVNETVVIT